MNKDLMYKYHHARNQKSIYENSVVPVYDDEKPMESHDASLPFLKLVYAVNPKTKLPNGDLQYMVSDKSNPEVKRWVLENLMMDTGQSATPSLTKGIDDDTILQLVRQPNEDRQSYANRVNQFMRENVELYGRLEETLRERKSFPSEAVKPAVPTE